MPQRPLRLNLSNYYYTTTWFGGQQDISVFFRNALNIFQAWKAPLPIYVSSHISLAGVLVFIVGCFPFYWCKLSNLVVNPRCSSIEHHNFKRNKAIFYVLLFNRLHRGDVARNSPVFVQQAPTTSTIPGDFLKNPPTSSNSVHESCVQFWSQPFFDGAWRKTWQRVLFAVKPW